MAIIIEILKLFPTSQLDTPHPRSGSTCLHGIIPPKKKYNPCHSYLLMFFSSSKKKEERGGGAIIGSRCSP